MLVELFNMLPLKPNEFLAVVSRTISIPPNTELPSPNAEFAAPPETLEYQLFVTLSIPPEIVENLPNEDTTFVSPPAIDA